jgi:hypothetical protein
MMVGLFLFAQILAAQSSEVLSVELKPATIAAYDRYVQVTEARIQAEMERPGAFLYVEGLPEARREEAFRTLRGGEVYMERLLTRDASGREMTSPDALIHHWLGAVFIPGVKLPQVIHFVEDYDHHQDFYKPEIVRSRLVSREGNNFKIFYRVRNHKVITVTLDTEHDVQYFPVDATHWHSKSVSTRITEIANAGEKDEHGKPIGRDGGFLWRIISWWKFEERDGGVYLECESVSLTRDLPTGLGWLIKPFVTSIPRESLVMTMTATREAVRKVYAAGKAGVQSDVKRKPAGRVTH